MASTTSSSSCTHRYPCCASRPPRFSCAALPNGHRPFPIEPPVPSPPSASLRLPNAVGHRHWPMGMRLFTFSSPHIHTCAHTKGNVVLADNKYTVLSLLRSHRDDNKDYALMPGHPYPVHACRLRTSASLTELQGLMEVPSLPLPSPTHLHCSACPPPCLASPVLLGPPPPSHPALPACR